MGIRDKDYQARLARMDYAYKIAKAQGLEVLEKDLKLRRAVFIPLEIPPKKLNEVTDLLADRIMSTMMPTMLVSLHDAFGFGKVRMIKFKEAFLKRCDMLAALDPLGGHYETTLDYAKELEKYGIEFKIETIEDVVRSNKEHRKRYADIDYVLDLLERKGYKDAAEEIRKYM